MTIIATTMILIMFVMQMVLVVLFIGSPLVSLVPDLLTHGLWCRNPNIPNITTQSHQKNMKKYSTSFQRSVVRHGVMHVRLLDQGVIQPQSVTLTKIANAPDPQHQQHQCKLFTFSCGPHIKERATIKSGNIIMLKKLFLDLKNCINILIFCGCFAIDH